MKILHPVFTLGLLLFGCPHLLAAEAPDPRTITVRGEAKVEVPPDFVEMKFRIIEENNSSERAMDRVNQRTNEVIDVVEDFAIEDEDIAMTGLVLERKFEFDRNENQNFEGYVVSREITIKLRDYSMYELLASELVRAEVGELDRIQSGVDNEDELKHRALESAARDARIRAEAIASGLQVNLGAPLEVGENQLRPLANNQQQFARGQALQEVMLSANRRGIEENELPPLFVPSNIEVYGTVWVMFELLAD